MPIAFFTVTPTEVSLEVGAGQAQTLGFSVIKTGEIEGVVFRNDNRNGRQDAGEAAFCEARVQVENSEIIAFSEDQGRFSLAKLPPRRWKTAVNTEPRGDGVAATNSATVEVLVCASGTASGVQLGLAPVQKVVINTFQKNQ